jgi:hypothetical protein
MKSILKSLLEAAVVILLIPQIFVFLYFFLPTIRSVESLGLFKPLVLLGLTISRLAGPILYILYLAISAINREKRRGFLSFVICTITGYLCVVAWNLVIFKNFSYGWSLLPILICSGGVGIYQLFQDKEKLARTKPELFLASE